MRLLMEIQLDSLIKKQNIRNSTSDISTKQDSNIGRLEHCKDNRMNGDTYKGLKRNKLNNKWEYVEKSSRVIIDKKVM